MAEQMTGFSHVTDFYDTIKQDSRINVYHISLYLALIQIRSAANWGNPITVYRSKVMLLARMSRRMYNKSMKELVEFGYLKYEPSCNPSEGSNVYLKKL